MSYDVSVAGESENITSNMRAFFIDFGVYPPDWHGKPRAEVGNSIETNLATIKSRRIEELKAKYDAPNGWGSVEGAVSFLETVMRACRKEQSDLVEVWW